MLPLDPVKILIIGAVALVVLGPDKLPAAARKASSLWQELAALRASLHAEVRAVVDEIPALADPTGVGARIRDGWGAVDPRQALYRSIGLTGADPAANPAANPAGNPAGDPGAN